MLGYPFSFKHLLILAFIVSSSSLYAQSVTTVFGPEVFSASLKGETYNRNFVAKSNSDGVLTLVSGDGSDLSPIQCKGSVLQKLACRVKNLAMALELALTRAQVVEISLNGKKVVTNGNYKREKGQLQVAIKTKSGQPISAIQNQLQIKLKGSPLARIKMDIKAQGGASDTVPPTLAFVNQRAVVTALPANVQINLQASETLSFASLAGVTLAISGNQASGLVTLNQAGALNLPLVLRDVAGNSLSQNLAFQLVLDQVSPGISSSLPLAFFTNQNSVNVPVVVSDDTQATTTLTLNGVQVLTTGSSNFVYALDLPLDGEYTLVISSVDEAGREATPVSIQITKDSQPPLITALNFEDGAIVNSRRLDVSGTVSEFSSVTVNGVAAAMSSPGIFSFSASSTTSFTATVRADRDGSFPILIQATDAANNQSSVSINVLVDTGSDRLWTYEECSIAGGQP